MSREKSRSPKNQNHKRKKRQASSQGKMLWRFFFFAGITVLSCTFGGFSALLLRATPLKNGLSSLHLPHSQSNLESVLPTNLNQPINVLVLGVDNSGHPHLGKFTPSEALAGNSDTMLLVRLIPDTHQINILSIPRDTLVQLPGYGIDKINDANVRGGPELAAKTVSHLLEDIPIDRYIRLDTEGFIQLVDVLGGVEVTVPKAMNYVDETQHLKIHLAAGRQKLNGQHLQEYVRFRQDELGDIGRVQRQQEVLKALLYTFLQPATLGRLPQLAQVVKDNVDTDLSVGEMLAVGQFLAGIDRQHVNLVMLPGRFSDKGEYHRSYWIENPEAATSILTRYFNVHPANAKAIPSYAVSGSQIKLAVANATGHPEEGIKIAAFLRKHGFPHTYITRHEIDSGTIPLLKTQIIAQRGNTEAANAVKTTLGRGQVQVTSTGDLTSDVTVVVGADLAALSLHQ